jgi:hypothetical protein
LSPTTTKNEKYDFRKRKEKYSIVYRIVSSSASLTGIVISNKILVGTRIATEKKESVKFDS